VGSALPVPSTTAQIATFSRGKGPSLHHVRSRTTGTNVELLHVQSAAIGPSNLDRHHWIRWMRRSMWSILTLRVPPQRLSKFYKVKRFKLNLGLKHKTNATFMDGKLYNDLSLSGLNPHMSGSFICVTSVRGKEKGTW
jgi:hypothetical protein